MTIFTQKVHFIIFSVRNSNKSHILSHHLRPYSSNSTPLQLLSRALTPGILLLAIQVIVPAQLLNLTLAVLLAGLTRVYKYVHVRCEHRKNRA